MSNFIFTVAYIIFAAGTAEISLRLHIFIKKPSKERLTQFRDNLPNYLRAIFFNENMTGLYKGNLEPRTVDHLLRASSDFPWVLLFMGIITIPSISVNYIDQIFVKNIYTPLDVILSCLAFSFHIRAFFFGIRM